MRKRPFKTFMRRLIGNWLRKIKKEIRVANPMSSAQEQLDVLTHLDHYFAIGSLQSLGKRLTRQEDSPAIKMVALIAASIGQGADGFLSSIRVGRDELKSVNHQLYALLVRTNKAPPFFCEPWALASGPAWMVAGARG